jgi:hypothetical protein
MELLTIKWEGKMKDLQCIQVLVPLRHLPLNPDVCSLRRCFSIGYSHEELPLEERIFLDTGDINSSKD